MNFELLIEKIERCSFECEGGPLVNCIDWKNLKIGIRINAEIKATETPLTAASGGFPDEPRLYSPHITDAGDVKAYATMWPNKFGNWMRKEDHDAHAAALSRELAAKEGEIVRLRSCVVQGCVGGEYVIRAEAADASEQQLAEQAARVIELETALNYVVNNIDTNCPHGLDMQIVEKPMKGSTP